VQHYLKRFVASAVVKAIALSLAFLLQLVLARVMGAEWYGEVTYALAWVSLLAVLAAAGTDGAAVRFVAELDLHDRRPDIAGFWHWAVCRSRQFLKFVLPAGLLLGMLLHYSNSEFAILAFLVVLPALYFQAGNLFLVSFVQGLRRPVMSQLPLGVALPLLLIAALFGLQGLDIEPRSEYVAAAYVVAVAIIYVCLKTFVKAQLDSADKPWDKPEAPEWGAVAYHLLLMSAAGLLLVRFDILLLGWFVPAEEVGVYNVSARLAEMASLALVVSNLVVAPMIARYFRDGEHGKLQSVLTFSGRLVAMVTLLAVLALFYFGQTVLGWYGEIFVRGYEILMILAIGQLINALFGPVGNVLIMTGHSGMALRIYVAAAAIMILLSLLLTPMFGMYGAAMATACGTIIWNVVMCRYIVTTLGIDPTALGVFRR